ncbi:DUF4342 domain-containing protein [Fimbriimonas ginsengisoli]|uniref:DUF4342 domain-containing protein n=1 Tax=Fimbriimonas ginsengisoli Gsoil 348 TaxID=661478 RepID=A0A068NV12_FIMGI|nr:DUF4342 domain-containing protein [Fimbriimonas ginsengisoli]AIE86575.1 hypothetical protein OP10G_3207 [Fimbriimonas ginsengisoli Gsoil 348]
MPNSVTEEIKITADGLIDTVRDLIHEGNVRHIAIKDSHGKTVIEFPVSIGLVGVLLAPTLAAVAAVAVFAADYTIVVTRDEPAAPPVVNDPGTPPTA